MSFRVIRGSFFRNLTTKYTKRHENSGTEQHKAELREVARKYSMFTVKAGYSDDIELISSIDRVREFFADLTNFSDLMPGIASIHTDAKGVAHWKIEADIPVVGSMMQKFAVELAENSEERIEWFPVAKETQNFLRFSADFLEKARNVTLVHFSQMVELRRKSARDLHLLAGLAGETLISNEMSKKITEMIKVFIQRAKDKLEK